MTNPIAAACRSCRKGSMQPIERMQTYAPPGTDGVVITQLAARCDQCGKETVLPSQMDENLRRRAARKAHYGLYLLGEEIFAFRRKYGLTQQAASRLFGKGIIAFSRYESEKSYPDESTTKLIRAAMRHPALLKELADESGVEIPLWEARCADEREREQESLATSRRPMTSLPRPTVQFLELMEQRTGPLRSAKASNIGATKANRRPKAPAAR